MMPNPQFSSQDKILQHLSEQKKEICKGNYNGVKELYPYIRDEENHTGLNDFTENFVLMTAKLEAREFDLQRRIAELGKKCCPGKA
jgi:hypothetical protein